MSSTTRHPRSAWPLIAGFVALAVVVVGAAYWAWAQQARSMRSQAERSVEAVGKLKATQVASWMEERNGDAEIIHGDRLLSTAVADLLAGRSGPESAAKVRSYLADYQRIYDYAGVTLVAPDGRTVLQAPVAPRHALDSSERALVAEAERTGQVTFSDLHLGEDDKPRMEIATPLAAETPGERAVASVLLLLDPGTFLFPFIQTWPLHSATGETLLVELRDGRVLFLNELRHRKDTALRLTSSATDPELPAAMAVRGKRGIVEGYDYRDVPVIAAIEAVPGTSWFVDLQDRHQRSRRSDPHARLAHGRVHSPRGRARGRRHAAPLARSRVAGRAPRSARARSATGRSSRTSRPASSSTRSTREIAREPASLRAARAVPRPASRQDRDGSGLALPRRGRHRAPAGSSTP